MTNSHYLKTTAILLTLCLIILADTGRLYTSDRLSSSLIKCIIQDKQGYIWAGTEYGLNKFDGYRFTEYLTDKNDSATIADNEVVTLLCDNAGRLWVGCGKGLSRYDHTTDKFVRYLFPEGIKPRVNSLIQSSAGDILIGTAGYGLFSIRRGTDKIRRESSFRKRKMDDFFSRMFEDEQHCLWRGSHLSTLTRITVKDGKATGVKDFMSPYGAPRDFLRTDDGGFLVVCLYGILRYDYAAGTLTDAGYDLSALGGNVSIRKAVTGGKGDIYIGTSGSGLMVIPRGSRTLRRTARNNSRFNLSASYINDILLDKDNNLWAGCYQKGLFMMNEGQDAFSSWSFSEQNHAIGSSVQSIALADGGDVLCTVQNTGVYRFDRQGNLTAHPQSPAGTTIIYRDRQGRFWLGTENTLYGYDPETGASKAVMTSDGWGMNCIADDRRGMLYVGNYGKGLTVFDPAAGKTERISMNQNGGKRGSLCNDWVKALLTDRYGMLWIGTADGVSCMNTANRDFCQYSGGTMLKGMQCTAICEQRQGSILLGTNDGLYRFDRIKNRLARFPYSEGLRNKLIYGIVEDSDGDLWLSTSMGIWQYSSKGRRFIAHTHGNGLTTKEYVQGAVMRADDGMTGFGTNDGITTFYPDNVRKSSMELDSVYLTNFIIDGKTVCSDDGEFTVAYNENSFTMEFSLLTYRNTDNITFEYRINDGSEWTSVSEGSNAISFVRMKPGKYRIEVRARSNGICSKGTRAVTVTVSDPWYASALAYIIYILAATGIVMLGVTYYVRKRKAEMEEAKMRFLINATHDIRSPLTLIMGPLAKLRQRIGDTECRNDIDTIDRNAQRLLLLVNQILDERKIDKNQMRLHCRKTDMTVFINGIYMLYAYNAQQRNMRYTFTHGEEKITAWVDRINFDKVISNLLSNAFKYTFDGGEIDVSLEQDGGEIVIKVTDNGIGLDEDKPERLFARFYQGSNHRGLHLDGTGIGLNLSKAIVTMHGGKITAANRCDGKRGTVLEIRLPAGNGHLKPEEIESDGALTDGTERRKRQASRNVRILIADDDKEIANYIRNELGCWYRFDAAPNGKEALKTLLTGSYDLVVSDIIMPEMDGITLLKKIKGNPNISDIPVILLTSKSEVSDRLEGLKKGADAFLAKPFSMDELHILIDNLIDNVRRLRGKFSGAQVQEEKMEKVTVKGNNDALMERIMKCINENLTDPDFNVERLTELVGISRAQLHRKMKEITGIPAGDFIRNLRLEQAARLIRERKINVTQVAYAVGFNNQTHFSTIFRKNFGMTPTEYAENKGDKQKSETN